jgi:hypothetical protein
VLAPPGEMHTALHFFRLGRPLWGSYPEQTIYKIQSFAQVKLFGGLSCFDAVSPERQIHVSLAVLGSRLGGLTPLRFSLASELVAGYMATCVHVAPDRESIAVAFPSEPALAAGAALTMQDTRTLVSMLTLLKDGMQNGDVSAGYRGELVARLVLLLCYDSFCSVDNPLPLVPLLEFLARLGVTSATKLDAGVHIYFEAANPAELYVRFNHFIPLSQPVQLSHLTMAAKRAAAVHFKPGQPGGDEAIPIINRCNTVVGSLSVQVKNVSSSVHDSHWPQSATSMLHCAHIYSLEDDSHADFVKNSVGLYLQLGAGKSFQVETAAALRSTATSAKSYSYHQHAAIFGMQFPFLSAEVTTALRSLLGLQDQAGAASSPTWWSMIFPLDATG